MSPCGATATSVGPIKLSGLPPSTPCFPSVIKTFPSGLILNTWFPLPFRTPQSVTQMLSSLSTSKLCGKTSNPEPKLLRNLPDESNSMIGATLDPTQLVPPQRSSTHTFPWLSTPTQNTCPQIRPGGSSPPFGISR